MSDRDIRQALVFRWVLETFGAANASRQERVMRFLEEAFELAQAEGVDSGKATALLAHVYGKPKGDPVQEVGGVGVTLLAYCQSIGISADDAERVEYRRVTALDPEHFRKRHNLKADAGVAERAPEKL